MNQLTKWLFLWLLLPPLLFAETSESISLDIQNVSIPDALRLMAKLTHRNIVVSATVTGRTSIHFAHTSAERAFDSLLEANDLTQYQQNQVWFVMPRKELLLQKEDEVKIQAILVAVAPLQQRIWRIHYAKAEELVHLLQDNNGSVLSKRGYLHVDSRTNSIYLQDIPERIAAVERLIKQLDVPVKQVLIETRLANVDSDFERELGVHFAMQAADDVRLPARIRGTEEDRASFTRYSLAVAHLADGKLLDMQLAALENSGHGELISTPSLFTANQQPASIESGEEIPYQEVSRSGATGVTFKKAVLSLKVTPQVLPGNKVLLQLQINQDQPGHRMVLGVPSIMTQQITTHVLAMNRQTIVLGGIFQSNKDRATEGIPFLSKIPLVGWLFQQQNVTEKKRELLIFVTPKIIDTGQYPE